jgi:acetolactate synthase-1/2/3 large subunit
MMNGAESLVRTLLACGIDTCFTNPGTSEMHFVAALDRIERMRCILALFEGVATGAADGYYRMRDAPAATLLHLGPGLSNGLANLHNARKASSGIVNIVGEHATTHLAFDPPLAADIEGIAKPVSAFTRTAADSTSLPGDAAAAIQAARRPPGQIATLILPANAAWSTAETVGTPLPDMPRRAPSSAAVEAAVRILRSGEPTVLLMGGRALREGALALGGRIAAASGCKLIAPLGNARMQRGAGRVGLGRVPYPVDQALALLAGVRHIILVEAREPVAFFAYPEKPSRMKPDGCEVHELCPLDGDSTATLEMLADALGDRRAAATVEKPVKTPPPSGALTPETLALALAAHLPEGAIVVDESLTSGRNLFPPTAGCPPHDWLQNMGGSIGFSTPVATGAAVACPDRKVICLVGDGSAMYTIQSLWTQARESLDVTTIVLANHGYQILKGEFAGVRAGAPGRRATDMLNIDRPDIGWCALSQGLGVPARKATTAEELSAALGAAMASSGPKLIEAQL